MAKLNREKKLRWFEKVFILSQIIQHTMGETKLENKGGVKRDTI